MQPWAGKYYLSSRFLWKLTNLHFAGFLYMKHYNILWKWFDAPSQVNLFMSSFKRKTDDQSAVQLKK